MLFWQKTTINYYSLCIINVSINNIKYIQRRERERYLFKMVRHNSHTKEIISNKQPRWKTCASEVVGSYSKWVGLAEPDHVFMER